MSKKQPKKEAEAALQGLTRRRIDGTPVPDMPTVYANNANIDMSNWDVKIRLGQIARSTPEVLTVNEVAHVYMTHEHAKALVDALSRVLGQLEKFQNPSSGNA